MHRTVARLEISCWVPSRGYHSDHCPALRGCLLGVGPAWCSTCCSALRPAQGSVLTWPWCAQQCLQIALRGPHLRCRSTPRKARLALCAVHNPSSYRIAELASPSCARQVALQRIGERLGSQSRKPSQKSPTALPTRHIGSGGHSAVFTVTSGPGPAVQHYRGSEKGLQVRKTVHDCRVHTCPCMGAQNISSHATAAYANSRTAPQVGGMHGTPLSALQRAWHPGYGSQLWSIIRLSGFQTCHLAVESYCMRACLHTLSPLGQVLNGACSVSPAYSASVHSAGEPFHTLDSGMNGAGRGLDVTLNGQWH